MEFGLIVLGAIVGALSTGGVSFYADYRRRHDERKVAARVILGDLFIVDLIGTRATERQRWPENYEWSIPLETWRTAREAFAADVKAAEWTIVDSTFRYLHGVALMAAPGDECSAADLQSVAELLKRVRRARAIVVEHTASKREQRAAVSELSD